MYFGVGAIVEEKIFAEIFLATAAVEAAQAGRGICGDYAKAIAPPRVDSLPHRRDFALPLRGRKPRAAGSSLA